MTWCIAFLVYVAFLAALCIFVEVVCGGEK